MAEALPGFEVVGWYGVIGRPIWPSRWSPSCTRAGQGPEQPDIKSRIEADGPEPVGSNPRTSAASHADLEKWGSW